MKVKNLITKLRNKLFKKYDQKNFELADLKTKELMDCGLNPFSYYVNNKKDDRQWDIEVKNFKKYLNKISPNFRMLWYIADFIKILEMLYMYHNVQKAPLYLMSTKSNIRSFIVNFDDFYIEYTLYEDDKRINCKVIRSWNDDAKSEITFIDGEYVVKTRADEVLMFTIIDLTMKKVYNIFDETYNKANIIQSNIYKNQENQ